MYWRKEMIEVNGILFQVLRRFGVEYFEKIIQSFSAQEICIAYGCDKVLRGNDGYFYLVNEVKDISWEQI
jgi:hypothetical protein